MDSVIARFLEVIPAQYLGDICSIDHGPHGLTVAWVWLPPKTNLVLEWEGMTVWNIQVGKYAFSDHDQLESEPECDAPF